MELGLKGKKAFVTGATRGIGLRIARLLAAEGAAVAICARDGAMVAATVEELKGNGTPAFGAVADLRSDGGDLKAAIDAAAVAFGGLDILIQNVSAIALRASEQDWETAYQTDLLGTLRCVDAGLPHIEKSTVGSIVIVGTSLAVTGAGGPQAYGAIKAALLHYASTLARALAAKNLRVNTVSPGAVYFEGGLWDRLKQDASPLEFQQVLARYPMGRMATPEEVANAVVFIASPAASFITGVNLMVDGGSTQRVQY